MRTLDTFTPSQIPQFLMRELPRAAGAEYPVFVEFVQAYYEFLRNYTVDIEQIRNVAITPDSLLEYFRRELAAGIDTSKAQIDERRFLEFTKAIYRRKGTIGGLELLFRLFYGEDIQVFEPYKQVLKASDGKWFQEKSILVKKTYNSADYLEVTGTPVVELRAPNGSLFNVKTIRVDRIDSGSSTRFYFTNYTRVLAQAGTVATIYDGNGKILYQGNLIKEPARVRVISGGKYWRCGQVFRIPGDADTIARVTSVTQEGGIDSVEIIRYGSGHTDGQTITLSPFRNKPAGNFTIDSEIVGYVPGTGAVYHHRLGLTDEILQFDENIRGYKTQNSTDRYDSQIYFAQDYVASLALNFKSITGSSATLTDDPFLTLEVWLASRATLVYEDDYIVSYLGSHKTADGQLSNEAIRLHDGYYYQLFSYVISSALGVEAYRDVLQLVHPAGTKFFAELQQSSVYTATLSGESSLVDQELTLQDSANADDIAPTFELGIIAEDETVTAVESYAVDSQILKGSSIVVEDVRGLTYEAEDYFAENYAIYEIQPEIVIS